MNTAEAARALHEDILNYIDQATAVLHSGKLADLYGLDEKIEALCQRVVALDEQARTPFVAQLESLQERLEDLTHLMQSTRDKLKTEMATLNQRERALKAYHKPKEGS